MTARSRLPARRCARPTAIKRSGLVGIERVQRIELFDFFARALLQPVQLRELFARGNERGRDGDRALERRARFGELLAILQAQPEHVVRFVKVRVQLDRLLQRRNRARQAPVAARRERQLVENRRGVIVEAEVRLVVFGGIREAPQLEVDVAEFFERAGGARVELRGGAQIAQGRRERFGRIAAALMRLAALQVGEHRAALQRDRAAVGLDRHERLPAARALRLPRSIRRRYSRSRSTAWSARMPAAARPASTMMPATTFFTARIVTGSPGMGPRPRNRTA